MPNPALPSTLAPKYWDKYKDLPSAQKKKLTEALNTAKSRHDKADFGALESVKPRSEADADTALKSFEAAVKATFDPLVAEFGSLQKTLKGLESEVKSDKKAPKGLAEDLAKAAVDAAGHAKAADLAVASARKALQAAADALAAASKKEKAAAAKTAPKEMTPPQRKLRAQAVQTLNLVRKNDPRTAGKLVALIGYIPSQVLRVSMGLRVNKSFVQQAVEPEQKGKLKWVHANLVWDAARKLAIFELKAPLQGGLKALKAGLAEQIKVKNVRIGVRKHTGEEDLPPAADEPDELEALQGEVAADAAAAEAEKDGQPTAADIAKRLADMASAINAALASGKRTKAQELVKKLGDARKAGDFHAADAALDEIDTLLDSEEPPAATAASSKEPAAAGAKADDPGELLKSLNRAIKDVEQGIETFRAEMKRVYAGETDQAEAVGKASQKLDAAKAVCAQPPVLSLMAAVVRKNDAAQRAAARQAVETFLETLKTHEVISQLDDNELVKLDVVGRLTNELRKAQGALA